MSETTENIKSCPYIKKCSGCQLGNLNYPSQLSFKQTRVIKLMGKFCHVDEIKGMDCPYHYRNKMQAAFFKKNGKLTSGIYQSVTGRITETENCLIEDKLSNEIALACRKLFDSFKMKPYNEEAGTGFVRHLLIRRGFATNEIMVVIVTAEGKFPSVRSFVNALINKFPDIKTIVWNINDTELFLALGEKNEILYGDGYIEDILCGLKFRISPRSFYQINPVQTEYLYSKTMELADLKLSDVVIDAYCGTGTIGLIAAEKVKKVIGVEVNQSAIDDAIKNAELNSITSVEFFCDDAGKFMVALAEKGEKADVVFTDPPRAGCSREFLQSLVKLSPRRIVYISCNPETLARDMQYLLHKGYRAEKIQPVDMFPHTRHVECIVCIQRNNGKED
ncbi:MAG: 23S rRNA (uracil(1939)-C(5))-methyltransferase RlmD [Ruminiclostridium sp.]|nr:23S rRNA (uracil(1939)-C(5))-methyltransferase RlmD [Ruminiclostridium sp.]